ncbi:MAG: hypothetical protein V1489_02325 [Candidatus Liptonbacteria bacterium]
MDAIKMIENHCQFCAMQIPADADFCPHCGKAIRVQPLSTSVGKQIFINAVSILLPPLGYWYTWKYYREYKRSGSIAAKMIAITSGVLTTLSLIISLWTTEYVINGLYQSLSQFNNLNF